MQNGRRNHRKRCAVILIQEGRQRESRVRRTSSAKDREDGEIPTRPCWASSEAECARGAMHEKVYLWEHVEIAREGPGLPDSPYRPDKAATPSTMRTRRAHRSVLRGLRARCRNSGSASIPTGEGTAALRRRDWPTRQSSRRQQGPIVTLPRLTADAGRLQQMPVIEALNGVAVGGGNRNWRLPCSDSFRFYAATSARFGLPEAEDRQPPGNAAEFHRGWGRGLTHMGGPMLLKRADHRPSRR